MLAHTFTESNISRPLFGAGTSFECDFKSVASKSAPPPSLATDSGGISNGAPVTPFTLPGVTNGGGTNNVAPAFLCQIIPFPNQPADNVRSDVADLNKSYWERWTDLDRQAGIVLARSLCLVMSAVFHRDNNIARGAQSCRKETTGQSLALVRGQQP